MLLIEADALENPAQNLSRRLEAAAAAQAAAAAANQCANGLILKPIKYKLRCSAGLMVSTIGAIANRLVHHENRW